MSEKKKAVVGLSGGVDSSVCALLLKEQGYDVYGVTLRLTRESEEYIPERPKICCGKEAVRDAEAVAALLKIPFFEAGYEELFSESVISRFARDYLSGKTPNPCALCNPAVKWRALLEKADELKAEFVATGHYAGVRKLPNGRWSICRPRSEEKDQTYMLYALTQEELSRTLFPLEGYEKEEIREIAEKAGLPVHQKPDSQEICFVPDDDYAGFLERNYKDRLPQEGNFVTKDGRVVGKHAGIHHYTIGQRKGLGLSLGHPVFVSELRPETDEVVVGEEAEVFSRVVYAKELCFMGRESLDGGTFLARVRYGHGLQKTHAEMVKEGFLKCTFEEPVRAAAPGQALVLYEGDLVAGGGTIVRPPA